MEIAMTIRLENPPLNDTGRLLVEILRVVMQDGRVLFLCPTGQSQALINRVRMKLSRERDKARSKARGRGIQEFQLHATVHQETHSGVRFDAIVMWLVRSRYQTVLLEVEKMLALDNIDSAGGAA
jgi:hypothetical protein